jgi:hypothetical protein
MSDQLLTLAKEIENETDGIIAILESNFANYSKGAQIICVVLFKQLHGLYKGTVLLIEKGLLDEATVLVRSMMEVAAYLLFISDSDHEERVEWYRHSLGLSKMIAVDDFNLVQPDGAEKIDDKFFIQSEQEALKYFRDKHQLPADFKDSDIRRKYTLKPKDAAYRLHGDSKKVYEVLYTSFWRSASSIAHGQDPFCFICRDGDRLSLQSKDSDEKCRININTSCVLLRISLENLNKFLILNQESVIASVHLKVTALFQILKKIHEEDHPQTE